MANEIYKITISAPGIASVTVLPDTDPAQVSGGYGGWTVTSRQRRVGLTVWNGKDPLRMTIPVLFDGVVGLISQEVPISRLSRMALPPTTGGEPPQVRVSGRNFPQPGPLIWVIENLNWGTNVIRDFAFNGVLARLRQDCVISLLEYRGDDRAAFRGINPGKVTASKAAPSASKTGWPKTYVVRSGDTLGKIALHFYGSAAKWKPIATANDIRDPQVVKVGRTLRIPAP